MRTKAIIIVFFLVLIGFETPAAAQFTPEELAQRPMWEEFLKTAKIIKKEKIGEGVTRPRRLYMKKGDIEGSGVWKSPAGADAELFDKWQAEIAAYRLDKLLGVNMVPPTVEKSSGGRKGSCQLFVELGMSELKRRKENIAIPPEKEGHLEKMTYLARAFDSLIANTDRSLQNTCYTRDWRRILIDHSRSFRSTGDYTRQLIYGRQGRKGEFPFLKLPRAFVDKVRALTFASIRNAVGDYLTSAEIKAILLRKEHILKEVEEMIKERGEDDVLY